MQLGAKEGPTHDTRAAQMGPWRGLDGGVAYGDVGRDAMANLLI